MFFHLFYADLKADIHLQIQIVEMYIMYYEIVKEKNILTVLIF